MADFSSAAINKRATQGAFVSPKEIVISGKTAIFTGANTGIGFECCSQLLDLRLGRLIMAVRSLPKGEEAKQQLFLQADLASYDSITAFVDYATTLDRLDIVINNAGVCKKSFALDPKTSHEKSIRVNYLGSAQCIPAELRFSSDTPTWAPFKEKDSVPLLTAFDKPQSFKFQDRYATSKLLGQLFLRELAKHMPSLVVVINAPNSGTVVGYAARSMQFLIALDASVGARALVDAAVNHGPTSQGQYVEDGKVVPMASFVYQPRGKAITKQLWQETMAELRFAGVEVFIRKVRK
ncbi:NAD(P)-binding protein [Aspergillus insuetus]